MGKTRVLVTGGSGFLGGRLLKRLSTDVEATGTFMQTARRELPLIQLDVTDRDAVRRLFSSGRFDICVHSAANCNVEWCEVHDQLAYTLNVEGTRNVVDACNATGTRLIFISTDHVFDGTPGTAYTEDVLPRPLQRYGASKLEAEGIVRTHAGSLTLRLPTLYGKHEPGEKESFLGHALRVLGQGEPLEADNVAIRYPVLIDDAADCIAHLLQCSVEGVLHYSSDQGVTKYEWGRLIAAVSDLDPDLVMPTTEGGTARRPKDNRLTSRRLGAIGLAPPREVGRVLRDLQLRSLCRGES
jgi:dTDP-4-dehydrorhamnose reductase